MKYLILLTALISLSGCLSPDGGSSASPTAERLVPDDSSGSDGSGGSTTTTTTSTSTTTTTQGFTLSSITGQTFTHANGTVQFNSTQVLDSRCGGTYNITNTSQSGGVITVTASLVSASYVYPGNNDCLVDLVTTWEYIGATGCTTANIGPTMVASFVTYTIEQISGGIAVERSLQTRQFRRSCSGPVVYINDTDIMNEENYF